MAPKRETALEAWGKELKYACKAAAMTGKQLAEALHVVPATVSQWMNGKRTPHLQDVERCDEKLGTDGYLARYFTKWVTQEAPGTWQGRWMAAEARASIIQEFDAYAIPGLLQTGDYARTVIQYNQHSSLPVEELVRRRIERQVILNDENPPMCVFVLDEYVLYRNVGGPDVMVEQLARLCDLAAQSNIVIKIVPAGSEYYAACPFMIIRFDKTEIANLDTTLGGQIIEDVDQITALTRSWEDIRETALSPKESLELIERVMEEWKL
jgi:transcriptional regulator with XRE-family HTH domain